jgi:hypothetical protein
MAGMLRRGGPAGQRRRQLPFAPTTRATIDAAIESEADVRLETVDVDVVLDQVLPGSGPFTCFVRSLARRIRTCRTGAARTSVRSLLLF